MKSTARTLWSKTLAGTLLGFSLAMAISALFAWLTPGGPAGLNKFQFVMWLVSPLWLLILGCVYFFRNARQAWLWLGAANLLAFTIYYLSRTLAF